jgi:uncharacterized protein YvpB
MIKLEAPYIDQSIKYPTGCESVTTVMLLQYLGYEITVDEWIDKFLEQKAFEIRDSRLYGANPNLYFCGSPYDADAFGCYAPVICKGLEKAIGKDYEIIDETGTATELLLHNYIDQGIPVIFWACIDMKEPVIGPEWRLFDTGEVFTWISNEHCMLLVGYDETGYYFHDPYENHGLIRYEKKLVEDRHRAQYQMAVGVKKRKTK